MSVKLFFGSLGFNGRGRKGGGGGGIWQIMRKCKAKKHHDYY